MAENKTKPTSQDVTDFIAAVPDEGRRSDAAKLGALLERITGEPPVMWGPSIVGFGRYHYRYDSGREGDAPLAGFSPRAKEIVVYFTPDVPHREELLARLGPHKAGKSCLYIKRLSDIDEHVLEQIVADSATKTRQRYPD